MEPITYTETPEGYLMPDLTLPSEGEVILGRYARLRKEYLQNHRQILFTNLLTTCTLNQHLMEIEQTAQDRLERIISQMAQSEGVTEDLKERDMMAWARKMNAIKASAEEIILQDLIYS